MSCSPPKKKIKEFGGSKHVSLLPDDKEKVTLTKLTKDFIILNKFRQSSLLSHNLNSEEKENEYLHKKMIFISLLVQILLRYIAHPLKWLGSRLEHLLNYHSSPRKEKVESSVKDGIGYLSMIGHLDPRIELDKEIKQGDERYYPLLSIMASKLAYENKSVVKKVVTHSWKMDFLNFYNFFNEYQHRSTTEAFIMHERNNEANMIVVAFRGTSPFDAYDWSTDFDFSWLKIKGMGKIHKGFMMALGLKKYHREGSDDEQGDYYGHWPRHIKQDHARPLAYYTIREKLKAIIANDKSAKFIVTGHSLGGALAILFPAILALHGELEILDRLEAIYTYGQPRVGNQKFGEFMKSNLRKHGIKYYRMVYGHDIVPKVPFDSSFMMFRHFGTCIHFNSYYQGKVIEEQQRSIKRHREAPRTKRLSLLMRAVEILKIHVLAMLSLLKEAAEILTMHVLATISAVWHLVRGFIIGYAAGPDYREGWVLIGARMLGILLPGAMEHFPQDYVNAIRLASEHLFRNYPA